MNEDEKLNKIEEEEEEEFSLSEDIVLSTRQHTSSESSRAGEKKKKKFKPGKFISKHLKIKKDEKKNDSGGENSETRSEDSSKSPNLGAITRNIARKLSRKNKSQVSPYESGESSQPDEPLNNERDVKEIEKVTKNNSNFSNDEEEMNPIELFKPISPVATERKSSINENKKVQLQITISGKKIEKIQTTPNVVGMSTEPIVENTTATDKASAPLQYYKSQNDIMLPSASAAVQVNKIRKEFFNVLVSEGSNNNDSMKKIKSISNDALPQSVSRSTLKQTNSEGHRNESDSKSKSEKEIEKYSIITSSLNSIISTAKDLENLEEKKGLKELKIVEESDAVKEYNIIDTAETIRRPRKLSNKVNVREVVKEFESLKDKETTAKSPVIAKKFVETFEELEQELLNDEMKKTKIPVAKPRTSVEINVKETDSQPTVHTQEAYKPYNLSFSSSFDELKTSSEHNKEEIKFELGTAVRPQKILSANSNNVTPILITASESESSTVNDSVDDVFHSPKSESEVVVKKRESRTRRKIAYIPQMTIYTPEEQELLKSNIIANSDSFDIPSLPPDSSIFPVFDDSLVSNMTPTTPEKREYLYKILVIGELGTGKTSFIKRYVHQFFSQNYRATIGVDFALKVLNWDQSTIIRLQLWDIAGQERFGNMTRVYYKEAVGAFIVFDVTRPATFDAVNKWKTDLDSKVQLPDGSPIPCILLANKCDQPKQGLISIPSKMDEYCKQNGFAGWFETSAKENTNIEESAKALVSKILLNDKLIHNDMVDGDRLILNAEDINKPKKFCSC